MVKPQKEKTKKKLKIQRLKRTQTKKDADLENKNNKSLSDISVQSVKQSFLAAPRGRHQMWNSSPLLKLNKQTNKKRARLLCFEQNVKGCPTHSKFSPGSNLKGGLWTAFLFKVHPCEKHILNIRTHKNWGKLQEKQAEILLSCKQS